MRPAKHLLAALLVAILSLSCSIKSSPRDTTQPKPTSTKLPEAAVNSVKVIHVFVALADNINQGIVPVSASLGNGDNPNTNLYWGAAFGVRTFFSKSRDWELVSTKASPRSGVLEQCLFKHRRQDIFLVADAYQGKEIERATNDFLEAAAGRPGEKISAKNFEFSTDGSAELVAYIGHNGLMDFRLSRIPVHRDKRERQAIILACASKQYFSMPLKSTGAHPLLWTTNLMAPESYVLDAALQGWIGRESNEQIRVRAASAYAKYQRIGIGGARSLFASGW
jgi:hypothetical protein